MQKKSIHVGMAGTRFMGRAHANAFHQVNRFFDLPAVLSLVAVAGRDSRRTAAFCKQWQVERAYGRWRDMVRDDRLDLVDVATPNHLHGEMALAAMEAGKHIACEKPLADSLDTARAMARASRRSSCHTFVWFNYRRCPAVALAYRWVRSGRIGRIRHIRAHYLQSWGGEETPMSWRFRRRQAGSGAHGDLNAHLVDLARFLSGDEVKTVHGAMATTFIRHRRTLGTKRKRSRVDVDDAFSFLVRMKGGATASFEASRLAPGHLNDNFIELNGEKGSLRFSFEDMNVLEFFDAELEEGSEGWRRIVCTDQRNHPYADAWWPDAHLIGYEHTFTNQAADMVRVLCGQEPLVPLASFEDAYQTQRVLRAAVLSASEGCTIPLTAVK